MLKTNQLPGIDVLTEAIEHMRGIRTANEENTVLNFNGSHAEIKEAIKRAKALSDSLTEPALCGIKTARLTLERQWSFFAGESDVDEELTQTADELADLLKRETFFRELPKIDQHSSAIQQAYVQRFDEAVKARADTYGDAVKKLKATPGWEQIEPDQQQRIAEPLVSAGGQNRPIPGRSKPAILKRR